MVATPIALGPTPSMEAGAVVVATSVGVEVLVVLTRDMGGSPGLVVVTVP
ncbi:MAG: hypothetical protein JRH20_08620 [Deltaproteobacteria bacterium]|nr:hypothetical protein [Deltaproteobacteria bacterium]